MTPQGVTFDGGASVIPLTPLSRTGRQAYPQGHLYSDIDGHLKARRTAETNGSFLWRVHDKLYDLTPYLDFHPGGREWLERVRGCDATEAFEAHHLDGDKAERALSKFYVREVEPGEFDCGDRFTYDADGFWRTVRERCLVALKGAVGPSTSTLDATSATPAMQIASGMILAQFISTFGLACVSGSWLAAGGCGLTMAGMWGVGHNYLHQSEKKAGWWPYALNVVPGINAEEFKVTHALSHHLVPNLKADYESGFYTSNGKHGFTNPEPLSLRYWYMKAAFIPILGAFKGAGTGIKKLVAGGPGSAWLPPLFPAAQLGLYRAAGNSWRESLKLWMIQMTVHTLAFVPFALGVHHNAVDPNDDGAELISKQGRSTYSWQEGQPGGVDDFGEHQVISTIDHSILSRQQHLPEVLVHWLSLTCFGYLNDHALHHLFPALDHSKHAIVRDVFEQTCREFKVPYQERGAIAMAAGFHRYVQNHQVVPLHSISKL